MANLRNNIVTVYYGPTNCRGARIRAVGGGESVVIPYDHALSPEDAHVKAARIIADRLGWKGRLYGSWVTVNGQGRYVWLCI
jgi:hypothetical protein